MGMVCGADHRPAGRYQDDWPEASIPSVPRGNPWGDAAVTFLSSLIEATEVATEDNPNAAIEAYCGSQGLEIPEGDDIPAATEKMDAAKQCLLEARTATSEARLYSLRPAEPECTQEDGQTSVRFESEKGVVILETQSETQEGAVWVVLYAGDVAGAPARPKLPGFSERNILEFWDKLQLVDPEEACSFLCWVRGVDKDSMDLRAEILHDYHFCVLLFAMQSKFSAEQATHLMALASSLFEQSVAGGCPNTKRGTFDQDRCFSLFKTALLALGAPALPQQPVFTEPQITAIVSYFAKTFFSHYELYVYIHINDQEPQQLEAMLPVETPMRPLKMAAGMSEEEHMEKLRAEAEAQKAAEDSAQRDREAAQLTKMLQEMDPETEKVVAAVVRRQERAMKKKYEDYYAELEEKIRNMEEQKGV